MFKTSKYLIVLILPMLLTSSFGVGIDTVSAQSYGGSGWDRSSEGVSDFNSEEEFEEFNDRHRESSSLRRKIDELDEDPVEDLPIPILFGVLINNLYSSFGDPRSGGREHEGIDIVAISGTPIVSPTQAVVLRVGDGSSSGNYVYTANPGGETFAYMHLDEIAEDLSSGDELETGDLIGFVGNTGNASGGAAHLHFEIRDNGATDPFPRITEVFDLDEKIDFVEKMLNEVSDEEELAEFLVTNYASTFLQAQAAKIELSAEIEEALKNRSVVILTTPSVSTSDNLTIGSRGVKVTALQTLLITKNVGPAAKAFASAGATGYFGVLTQAALAEYQASVGIAPAVGYYGPITRAYISKNP